MSCAQTGRFEPADDILESHLFKCLTPLLSRDLLLARWNTTRRTIHAGHSVPSIMLSPEDDLVAHHPQGGEPTHPSPPWLGVFLAAGRPVGGADEGRRVMLRWSQGYSQRTFRRSRAIQAGESHAG